MKKRKKRNQIIASIICILLVAAMLVTSVITVFADEAKVLTLGNDLSAAQKELVLNYLGVKEEEVVSITVTNEDEHRLLDNIATQQQIGTHTYSCAYIEPTNDGGIHIKTVNINWVTCEMIRNALVTSGISNCNVIVVAPIEVSGTGALTGIFMAYENVTGEEIDATKKELASEELIETCEIAGTIGQEEASTMVSELKEQVITGEVTDEEDIQTMVNGYLITKKYELTDEQIATLSSLLSKISVEGYNIEDVQKAYADIKQNAEDAKKAAEETMNILEKIGNWFTTMWQKITGKYEEVQASEEAEAIKEQLGILANTNDSLLGDSTVITVTEDTEVMEEVAPEENKEETETKSDKHWYDWIVAIFNSGQANNDTETPEETESTTTFEDFGTDESQQFTPSTEEVEDTTESTEEGTNDVSEESTEKSSTLDYVTYDFKASNTTDSETVN